MVYRKIGTNAVEVCHEGVTYIINGVNFEGSNVETSNVESSNAFIKYKRYKWSRYYSEEPDYEDFKWFVDNVVLVNKQFYSNQKTMVDQNKNKNQKTWKL